ncbi:MAG: septum formation initiator family protein [Ignavibacteria bacterium]|jgi:cell division protein FtsB|nr:septum formation initiator family protein [Ignavibacteria bacterium]
MKNRIGTLLNNRKYVAALATGVIVLLLLLFSNYGLVKRFSLERQTNELQKEIAMYKQIEDSMQIKIAKLRNDTLEIERIAREKYGMQKPSEVIYYIKKSGE